MFLFIFDLFQKYNIFGIISFVIPFMVFYYHIYKSRRDKNETELKKMRNNVPDFNKDISEPVETEEKDDDTDGDDDLKSRLNKELVYLKKIDNFKSRKVDAAILQDYRLELEEFFAKYSTTNDLMIYPGGINMMYDCLKICESHIVFCGNEITMTLQQILKTVDAITVLFNNNDLADFNACIYKSKNEIMHYTKKEKYLFIERLQEKTGKVNCINNKFIELAKENDIKIILNESIALNPNQTIGKFNTEIDLIICDTKNLNNYINGFCCGSKDVIEQIKPTEPMKIMLSPKSADEIKNFFQEIENLQNVSKVLEKFLRKTKRLEVCNDEASPVKVFKINIESTRENYHKTFKDFCKAQSVFVDINEFGIIMHLYSDLYKDNAKINYLKKVFRNALIFCLEKENVAQRL